MLGLGLKVQSYGFREFGFRYALKLFVAVLFLHHC